MWERINSVISVFVVRPVRPYVFAYVRACERAIDGIEWKQNSIMLKKAICIDVIQIFGRAMPM